MRTYLIMQNPGHSRVYYNESTKLALAELQIASKRFENKCYDIKIDVVKDVSYLSFGLEEEITPKEMNIVSKLSFIFALFELVENDSEVLLKPVACKNVEYVDSKISNILKYPGKTNELFTKMMVNVALLSSEYDYDHDIKLLDPVAGKGTTLYEGAVYGFDVAGVDINKNSVLEAGSFFKKYLEREKYKHQLNKVKGSKKNPGIFTDIHEFEYAASKDEYKDESTRKKFTYIAGDTSNINKYFRKDNFHIVVGDLPYGIAHGNVQKDKKLSPSRNPLTLLSDSLPEWHKVLRKGGVVVLSWNKFVLSRNDIIEAFNSNGYEVIAEHPYCNFEHRVDQSIKRDIIVAKKML